MATETLTRPTVDSEKKLDHPWRVVLYNCDCHSMDEVVFALQRATGCSLEKAESIMYEAHQRGRAICYSGPKLECERVVSVLRTTKLQVELDHD